MDHLTGQPLLNGLTATNALRRAPTLYRQLPDLLAEAAAHIHRCPNDGPDLDVHSGHPWVALRPVLEAQIAPGPS